MNPNLETVRQNLLFENVSEEVLEHCILPRGTVLKLEQGENVFLPLEQVNTVQILLSGKIKLAYYMANGEEDIRNLLMPGELIGIDLVCTRTQLSPYQATAVEKSEIFSMSASDFLEPGILPEVTRLACLRNLLIILSQINMRNEYRLAILMRNSLRERILVYLFMQANRNMSDTFSIPFTREEMASFLRVNRSALSHELSLMKQEGIIDFSRNRFTLLKKNSASYDVAAF